MRLRPALAAAALAGALAASLPAGADAHFNGQVNNSIPAAAGPVVEGSGYSGSFATPDDVDYYYYFIPRPGTLHFTVRNTLQTCSPPGLNYCPVYATLLDAAGNQLGGEGSAAGTGEVDFGDSDTIDWTFPAAGVYLLVLDSNGDLPGYQFDFSSSPAGTGPGTGNIPPSGQSRPFGSLQVRSRQRGNVVRVALRVLRNGTTVRARLTIGGSKSRLLAGKITRRSLPAGRVQLEIPLTRRARRALARAGRLRLSLRLSVSARGWPTSTTIRHLTLLAAR